MVIVHLQPNRARKMGEKKASRKVSGVQILSLMSCVSLGRSLTVCTGFLTALVLAHEDVTSKFCLLGKENLFGDFLGPWRVKISNKFCSKEKRKAKDELDFLQPSISKMYLTTGPFL